VGARLGQLNKHLEGQLDGLRDTAVHALGAGMRQGLDTQRVAAREAGAFGALAQTLQALLAAGEVPTAVAPALRDCLQRMQASFEAVNGALDAAAPAVALPESQSAQYQAFAQALRDMALLEATMQQVAESGQAVLQRLSAGRQTPEAR